MRTCAVRTSARWSCGNLVRRWTTEHGAVYQCLLCGETIGVTIQTPPEDRDAAAVRGHVCGIGGADDDEEDPADECGASGSAEGLRSDPQREHELLTEGFVFTDPSEYHPLSIDERQAKVFAMCPRAKDLRDKILKIGGERVICA